MPVKQISTRGWLLRKVPLANDDTLLVFLTENRGKVKVFASKLQCSKKKSAELDYFRWLELDLSLPKDTFKLQGVRTLTDYSTHLQSYEITELSFNLLSYIARFCPEEKAVPEMNQLLHEFLTLKSLPVSVMAAFFYTKLLWYSGILPRFDVLRGDIWVHPVTLLFTSTPQTDAIALTNHQRQMLEWMRRHNTTDLLSTYDKFSEHDLVILQAFLIAVIENH